MQINGQVKREGEVWEGPGLGSSRPNGVWVHNPSSVDVFTNLPQTLYYWGFMEAFSQRHDQSSSISSPFPSLENGERRLKIPSFLSWFGLPGDQLQSRNKPPAHPPRVTSLESKMSLVLWPLTNLQGFWELCVMNWGHEPVGVFSILS